MRIMTVMAVATVMTVRTAVIIVIIVMITINSKLKTVHYTISLAAPTGAVLSEVLPVQSQP